MCRFSLQEVKLSFLPTSLQDEPDLENRLKEQSVDKRHSDLAVGEPGELRFSKWRRSTRPAVLVASDAPSLMCPTQRLPLWPSFQSPTPQPNIRPSRSSLGGLAWDTRACSQGQETLGKLRLPGTRGDLPVVPGNPGQREHIPGDTGTPSSPVPVLAHWLGHTGRDYRRSAMGDASRGYVGSLNWLHNFSVNLNLSPKCIKNAISLFLLIFGFDLI